MKIEDISAPFLTAMMVGLLFFFAAEQAQANGTETLGPPSINIASGSGLITAGVGLQLQQPAELIIEIPQNVDVMQVLLYWEGQMDANVPGDDTIQVNGQSVTGELIGGPAFFYTNTYSSSFRADITSLGFVTNGTNKLVVDELDFVKANNGVGVLVIIDDDVNTADIGIRDGLDLAFINFPEPRKSTVKQTFSFQPGSEERSAVLTLFASSVADGSPRPNSIEVTIDGNTTIYSDLLVSNCGLEWDNLLIPVTIPAGITELSVQVFSRDDQGTGYLPASLAWIAAFLSIQEGAGGGEGLTPGFWKQAHHFDWWVKYGPGDDYETVFGVDSSFKEDLLGALQLGGGGEEALARHAVAGLLNAVSPKVNYLYTEVEVIDMVQDAYLTGDFETAKDLLEEQNELGLNGDPAGLWVDTPPNKYGTISASAGGNVDILLVTKPHFANRDYLILGSLSGAFPGTKLPNSALIPLNWDLFTGVVINNVNGPFFSDFMSTLDGNGRADAQFNALPVSPSLIGTDLNFAYLLGSPIQVICGWSVWVEILP